MAPAAANIARQRTLCGLPSFPDALRAILIGPASSLPGAVAISSNKFPRLGRLSSSLAAFLAPPPPPQYQPRATRPCGPSGRPLAGSIPTQLAGPLSFLPFAAALLPPLGRRRCNAARLFIPSKSPWDESETPTTFRCFVQKCTQATKKASALGLAPTEAWVGITSSRPDPQGST